MEITWFGDIEFNRNSLERLENKGGVYILSVRLKIGSLRVFYVGKSEDLKKRLLEHLSGTNSSECIQKHMENHYVYFNYAYVNSEEDRKNIEHTLYHHFGKPECNDVEPEGEMIEINFD